MKFEEVKEMKNADIRIQFSGKAIIIAYFNTNSLLNQAVN